jgi:phosphoenolpyruvate synthase/pyruvate phosphate dikinase
MVIEISPGGAQTVTAGTGTPHRLIVSRQGGDVLTDEGAAGRNSTAAVNIGEIANHFIELERHFGCALDIEWAIQDGTTYILQVRPVVGQGNAM